MAITRGLHFGDAPAERRAGSDVVPGQEAAGGTGVPRYVLLCALYTLAALGSLYLSREPSSIAGIWFANAIAVAFFATSPRRDWLGLALAVALSVPLANWLWGDNPLKAMSFLPANLIEIVLAGWLLQRFGVRAASVSSFAGMAKLLLLGGVVPQIVGATGGALTVTWYTEAGFAAVWTSWLASSAIGATSLLPLALVLSEQGSAALRPVLQDWRQLALALAVAVTTVLSIGTVPYPFVFVLLPLLIAAAWTSAFVVALLTAIASVSIATGIGTGWFRLREVDGLLEQAAVYFAYAASLVPAHLLAATVCELRESRRRLLEQSEALQQAHDGLEQFVRFASHDLREPLNGIAGLAALLEREAGTNMPEAPRRYVALMAGAAGHMRRLLDDMLTFTRARQLDRDSTTATVSLDEVFARLRDTLAWSIAAKSARIEIEELGSVPGHPTMLPLVFQNLLSNALKFVEAGKRPHVRVFAQRHGDQLIVAVRDNGVGIDPAQTDKLFQPFRRLHARSAYEGTGLGLALAKQIVDAHCGRIEVQSAPGQGSTFLVYLPVNRA